MNAPTNQPFVAGTPYYATDTGYPAYNPSQAKALVKEIETETGKPVAFTLAVHHLGLLGPGRRSSSRASSRPSG